MAHEALHTKPSLLTKPPNMKGDFETTQVALKTKNFPDGTFQALPFPAGKY